MKGNQTARERIALRNLRAMERLRARNVNQSNLLEPQMVSNVKRKNSVKKHQHDKELANKIRERELKQFQQFKIRRITDMDVFMNEMTDDCIRMPCGHGIPVLTLYQYVKSLFLTGDNNIKCPSILNKTKNTLCHQDWCFDIARKILVWDIEKKTNDDEKSVQNEALEYENIMELELIAARNVLKNNFDVKKCNNCKSMIYRKQKPIHEIEPSCVCPLCPKNKFCWVCGCKWNNEQNKCKNSSCWMNSFQENSNLLANCITKKILDVDGVPSIRACPKCSQLINHSQACKHMKCYFCQVEFCFVCLKEKLHGNWQCGTHSSICPVAARQKLECLRLPNLTTTILF